MVMMHRVTTCFNTVLPIRLQTVRHLVRLPPSYSHEPGRTWRFTNCPGRGS